MKRKGGERITIHLTEALRGRIDEVVQRDNQRRKRHVTTSEIVREAIRFYLDHRDDVTGSRRHFIMQFRAGLGAIRTMLIILIILMARIGALLTLEIDDLTRQRLENLSSENAALEIDLLVKNQALSLVRHAIEETSAEGVLLESRILDLAADLEISRTMLEEKST